MHGRQSGLSFRLLGPVGGRAGDEPLAVGSPQQQAVLAMLLLREGRAVSMAELVDGLWGEEPPRTAHRTVLTYVSRLRTVLEPGRRAGESGGVLVSVPGGYALRAEGIEVDSVRFEREATDRRGGVRAVHDRLDGALGRWRGAALAGVPGPWAQRERDRLEELRSTAREALFGHALDLGRHAQVVPELQAMVAEFPLRERLSELLMLALYRCGRQAEALAVHRAAREALRTELGIAPSASLTEVQRRILTADPGLMASGEQSGAGGRAARPAAPAPSVRPLPQQLPSDIADFTGRDAAVDAILAVLDGDGEEQKHAVTVCTVSGTAGVGKTAVAVHVAHALGEAYPDGRLHVDLGAGSTPADPASVLADFLAALGTPSDRIPLGLEQRAALYRTLLADRRVLLVLDNALDAEQIRPLLPGTAGCAVLVTCRSRDLALPGAHRFDLDVPPGSEALALLAAIVGPERVNAEPEAARALVEACGRLPLAVRIAASRLDGRPGRSIASLEQRLQDERARLDELRVGGLAVASAFRLGYGALPPDAARAFRLLALSDAPDIPLPVAAALLDTDERTAEHLAETLVDAGMLESHTPDRYRFHDLLRLYARHGTDHTDPPAEHEAALVRVAELLIATALRAARAVVPAEPPRAWLQPVRHSGVAFAGAEEVREWFGAEHALLTAAVNQLLPWGPHALRTAIELLGVVAVSGHFMGRAHYLEISRIAGAAADRTLARQDPEYRARALHTRAWLAFLAARHEAAEADLRTALRCAAETGSALRHHMSGILLALVLWATDRPEEAERTMHEAARFAGDLQDPASPASVARYVARLYTALGSRQPDVTVMTPVMRTADATGESLTTTEGLQRLGTLLRRPDPDPSDQRRARALPNSP
ncbi:AfsR/SARP family transcriptional regulator [Streptomyces spectabilis]|uniref:AfsR family transcriptional regulator n=1 Tax=Streptomyces spectabilis TaxID=68270 RepID=A0A5P2XLN9_STRST|nr:BTAD domain-containing putative transcriptional regulator [Streptomyces spectabilis]MBB5102164.1 DNA-binding SARP family transcriptional activator [Streptomyces spectabilis]MCI3907212.1 NB-ARC domain-containing protein [Streptomyces spectabilis]QEV63960.1 AfsR family transcriptional regulator [Streptomyces spectabilis]GGV29163.1 regulatory protein AfsR [Streptomyces spectabilis]